MHRLFVGIRPPEHIRDLLIDAMDDSADFRWQTDEQLHVTLRFVGEVERHVAEDLAAALDRIRAPAFALRIAGVGRFDHSNSGTLWAGNAPKEPVAALAAKIERLCTSLGLKPERRTFHPHITLARWYGRREHEVLRYLDSHDSLRSEAFDVIEFVLFESRLSRHGSHYEPVARYPLSEASPKS
jgi:2'-5' RNA ligase